MLFGKYSVLANLYDSAFSLIEAKLYLIINHHYQLIHIKGGMSQILKVVVFNFVNILRLSGH